MVNYWHNMPILFEMLKALGQQTVDKISFMSAIFDKEWVWGSPARLHRQDLSIHRDSLSLCSKLPRFLLVLVRVPSSDNRALQIQSLSQPDFKLCQQGWCEPPAVRWVIYTYLAIHMDGMVGPIQFVALTLSPHSFSRSCSSPFENRQ